MTKALLDAFEQEMAGLSRVELRMRPRFGAEDGDLWFSVYAHASGVLQSSGWVTGAPSTGMPPRSETPSQTLTRLVGVLGDEPRPWTLEVKIAPANAKRRDAIRDAALAAIRSLSTAPWPSDEIMERERKAWTTAEKEQKAKGKAVRDEKRAKAKAAEERRQAQIIAGARTETVADVPGLIEVLKTRLGDPGRIDKTLSMLKRDGFQLFSDVTDEKLEGVVKSQTDSDLVYACHLGRDGAFHCCTQHLNVCGGLRGKPCKHILTLVIGLTRAGVLPLASANDWMIATLVREPKLDKERAADVLLRYRSAEAGELDWRPTETVPEDFYSY